MRVQAPRDASHNHPNHTPATDRQRRFARQLVEERGGNVYPLFDGQGALAERAFDLTADPTKFVSKTEASAVIDHLLATPAVRTSGPAPIAAATPATEKQRDLVARLLEQKDLAGTKYEGWTPDWTKPASTKRAASAVIDYLLTLPKKPATRATVAADDPEAGVYRSEDGRHLVRVYFGQNSGRMLAKPVIETTEACYCSDLQGVPCRVCKGEAKRTYALGEPMLALRLFDVIGQAMTKLGLEEAKEWGRTTGHCVMCAHRLDVPESVDAGIGPKCAGRV